MFSVLLIAFCIYLIFNNKDSSLKCYDEVDFNDVFQDISSSTIGSFTISDSSEIYNKFFIDWDSIEKKMILINTENEHSYFALISDPNEVNKKIIEKELNIYKEKYYEFYKNSVLNHINGYTYVVVSNEYANTIEGIIQSYMNCE